MIEINEQSKETFMFIENCFVTGEIDELNKEIFMFTEAVLHSVKHFTGWNMEGIHQIVREKG